jgi:hypothetical protein
MRRAILLFNQHKDDCRLLAAGFEPIESNALWKKDGVLFGREAALQGAWQERREHKGPKSFKEV